MLTYLVAFVLSFAIAATLTPLLRALAPLVGGIDRAQSSRKVHTAPIPRIGGIAIVIAFFVPLVGLFVYRNDVSTLFLKDSSRVAGLFAGGLAIAGLGFYDDVHGAGAKLKFLVQFAVGLLVFALGYRIEVLANPFGTPLPLGMLSLPFTLLWVVGIINAMNLIDGLDGLAGGIAVIVVGLTFAVAFNRPDVLMCLLMASLGGALVGFLLYNFNPATIFMGDTGSMFLGFVLAVSTVASSQKSSTAVAMLVPILALGLPIADTLLAMLRRALRGRPLFSADREHIHHKLLALGFTQRQAVLALYGVGLVLAIAAFAVSFANSRDTALVLGGLAILAVVALRTLGYVELGRSASRANAESRSRNQNLRGVVRDIQERLREADRVEVVWDAVKYIAPALDAREMSLSVILDQRGGEQVREVLSWRSEPSAPVPAAAGCSVRLDLEAPGGSREALGQVRVVWTDGRREVLRDDEIALELLVDHVENALSRIRRSARGGEPAGTSPPADSTVVDLRRRSS